VDHNPPILSFPLLLGWQAHTTMTDFFSIEMEACALFCSVGPQTVSLPISACCITWDDRCEPSYLLRWGLTIFFPSRSGLELQSFQSQPPK
jgi:hypothetical protein